MVASAFELNDPPAPWAALAPQLRVQRLERLLVRVRRTRPEKPMSFPLSRLARRRPTSPTLDARLLRCRRRSEELRARFDEAVKPLSGAELDLLRFEEDDFGGDKEGLGEGEGAGLVVAGRGHEALVDGRPEEEVLETSAAVDVVVFTGDGDGGMGGERVATDDALDAGLHWCGTKRRRTRVRWTNDFPL